MIPNPWVILGAVGFLLLSVTGAWFLGDSHGTFVERAAQTAANLEQAKRDLADHKKNDQIADKAGKDFEDAKPQIRERIIERTNTVQVPPDADPHMPVWFVRLWDRLATGDAASDAYPGQSPSAASDVRLSEVREKLTAWVEKYELAGRQIDGARELKPVLPKVEEPPQSLIDRINPF